MAPPLRRMGWARRRRRRSDRALSPANSCGRVRSKPGMPVWREADGKNVSLVITRAGRDAIGVGDDVTASDRSARKAARASAAAKTQKASAAAQPELRSIGAAPRPGSKQALLVEMLSQGRRRVDRCADQGDWLAAAYDTGGADGAAQEWICSRTDPARA